MPTKPLTPYCAFVKQHYHTPDILKLPVRGRIKELARRWTHTTGICVPTQHPDYNNTHGVQNTKRCIFTVSVIQSENDPETPHPKW